MARSPAPGCRTSLDEVCSALDTLRREGKTVVTTNGCFDIIHRGHINYLWEASACGDILVVGINADSVVRGLKGENRPIQPQEDRCAIVGALAMVDFAFVFPEKDPRAFLERIQPDIHVKGGDYSRDIIEREVVERHGGVIRIVTLTENRSTSSIVSRISASG